MRLDGLEPAIVFFVSLLNVITQSVTQILILAPEPHILRAQHSDVLHGNLGDSEGPPVQFLLFWWQQVEIKNRRRFRGFTCGLRLLCRAQLAGKIQIELRRRLVRGHRRGFVQEDRL